MRNKKKVKILIGILFLISLLSLFLALNFANIKIFYYETSYKINSNSDNLIKLCLNLRYTKNYDKKIEYIPKLLNNSTAFNDINKFLVKGSNKNIAFDEMQYEYLFSYFHLGQYDTFKKKYIEDYSKFKMLGYQYTYLTEIVFDKLTTVKQLNVILETLQANYSNLANKPLDQMGNLNIQHYIYQRLGDTLNEKTVELKTKELVDALSKKK